MDMEEKETVSIHSRKELRKQKLMEYLAAKGKLTQLNHKSDPPGDCRVKKTLASASKVVPGKENKAPAEEFKYRGPKASAVASQSKVNEKSRVLTGRQNAILPSVVSIPAKLKPNQNHVLARLQPSVSSRSKLNASSQLKKQANAGSCRFSNPAAHITTVTKSNSRFSSSSNATVTCLIKDVRMSLGPLVKTKTGLIPAMMQSRSNQSQKGTSTTAAAVSIMTSVDHKVRAGTLPLVSKRSALAQAKTRSVSGTDHPGNENTSIKSTARNGLKIQGQIKSNSKPFLGKLSQPLGRNQTLTGPKSTSSFPKCTTAPVKPEGRAGMANTKKSTGQNADKFTKQRTEGKKDEDGRQYRADPRACGRPVSRCSSRAFSGTQRPAVAQVGGKTKKPKEADGMKRHTKVNPPPPPPQTGLKRTGAPVVSKTMSKTVPQPMRTINFTGQAAATKTTKIPVRIIPQTEGKKLTAVQEERMRKLQEWRESKGISYKRPPMQVKPQVKRTVAIPQPFWATMKEEDEAHSLISAVDRSLADCIKLLGEGCPTDQVKSVLSRLPAVSQKFAKYWICQVRLMEQEGNRDVLPMFEEAVSVVVEPVDELRTVVFEILKKKDEIQAYDEKKKGEEQMLQSENTSESIMDPLMTPKPVRALICGEKGNSSVVKYKITATPGGPQSQRKEHAQVNGQDIRFFTPVRRSVRIERASLRYPASLQDHDLCVASYHDLMSKHEDKEECGEEDCETSPPTNKTPMYIYRQNEALQDKVSVQLVYDDV